MGNRGPERESPPFRTTVLIVHVLLSLADEPAHAYGIMKEIARRTGGRVNPGPGAIHLTLNKLLDSEMIAESDARKRPGDDARRRYYALTARGRSFLADEIHALDEILAVARSKGLAMQRRG